MLTVILPKLFRTVFFFSQTNGINGPSSATEASDKSLLPSEKQPNISPVCRFVNVKLCGVEPAQGAKGHEATVLLENPQGEYLLNLDHLTREVSYLGIQYASSNPGNFTVIPVLFF